MCVSKCCQIHAQEVKMLTLEDIISLTSANAPSIKNARNEYETSFWRFKNYKAQLKPNLSFEGELPNFYKASTAVTQSDGSTEFMNVTQNYMYGNLSLSQIIPFSGTEIWASTNYTRVDNEVLPNH